MPAGLSLSGYQPHPSVLYLHVLSTHLTDNQICLLKAGAGLIQVHFNVFACLRNWIHPCLIHAACLIEVPTKIGLLYI